MAVVLVQEVTGSAGDQDMATRKRYTRVFQVLTDDAKTRSKEVRDHADLPNYGDQWEQVDEVGFVTDSDPDSRCIEKRATQGDGENLMNWQVFCEYVGTEDPTAEPPRITWSDEKYQETLRTDPVSGDLIANSAEDAYESGVTRDRTRRVVVIEKNVLSWDPLEEDQYVDTTNDIPFLAARYPPGFDIGTCKIESINAEVVFSPNYPLDTDPWYYRKTTRIAIDRRGWNAVLLDAGFHAIVSILGVDYRGKIVLPGGGTPSIAQPLDGSGGVLPVGGTPVYRTFAKYEPADWSPLDLEY